jgi:DNA-binding NarL/FixJ family response regulator
MITRILIADDHDIVRDGLKMIIESQGDLRVVGTACDGHDVIRRAEELHPDIILMDISMPELNGIEASRLIKVRYPGIRIIILSMHYTSEHVFRAMYAGAQGYLLKESAGSEVVAALRAVIKGQRFFGRGVELPVDMRTGVTTSLPKSPLDSLSQREREVLQYVVEGRTSAEIAELLSLSPKSVETYRSRLMVKLGIPNIPALVKFALQHGITPTTYITQ